MTSIYDCIQRAVDAKELNPARGARPRANSINWWPGMRRSCCRAPQLKARAGADLKGNPEGCPRALSPVVNQLQAMRRLKAAVEDAPDSALALRNLIEYSGVRLHRGECPVDP